MATTSVADAKRFPLIVKIQVIVAIVAVAVTVVAAFRLGPLIEKKRQLEVEIHKLEVELSKLTADKEALTKEVEAGQEVGVETLAKSPVTNTLPDALKQTLKAAPRGVRLTARPVPNRAGYVVLLGSYRQIAIAIADLPSFRRRTGEPVDLFWSVNGYIAAAVGVFRTREEASSKQRQVRSAVKDAYVFGTWAYPYKLDVDAQ
jgi:cell division protein FtsL